MSTRSNKIRRRRRRRRRPGGGKKRQVYYYYCCCCCCCYYYYYYYYYYYALTMQTTPTKTVPPPLEPLRRPVAVKRSLPRGTPSGVLAKKVAAEIGATSPSKMGMDRARQIASSLRLVD